MTDDEVLQLAMYTAALDAKRWGAEFQPGVYQPTWEDRGPAGQEAYIADARTQFEAVETIQRIRRPDWTELPTGDLAQALQALTESRARFGDMEQRALAAEAVIEKVRAEADKDERGALRWHDPLPVPDWVPRVRALLAGAQSPACAVCVKPSTYRLGMPEPSWCDEHGPKPSVTGDTR